MVSFLLESPNLGIMCSTAEFFTLVVSYAITEMAFNSPCCVFDIYRFVFYLVSVAEDLQLEERNDKGKEFGSGADQTPA